MSFLTNMIKTTAAPIIQQQRAAEDKKIEAQNIASGKNADGSAIRPEFQSLIDPATGKMKEQYQLQALPDVTVDQRGINAIRDRALASGPSAWAKMMTDRQSLEEAKAADDARQGAMTQSAQGYADLGMRGGISAASRERLAAGNAKNAMLQGQQVARQGQLDRMNIGLQDEQQRQDSLKTLTGLDFQNANVAMQNRNYSTDVNTKNLTALLNENQNKRNWDMDTYKEQMQTWAANKQADAQARASGGKK